MKGRMWTGHGFGRSRALAVCLAVLVLFAFDFVPAPAQTPQQNPDDSQAISDPANVARITFAQGEVKLGMEGQTAFNTVVQNMPVMAGAEIQTGADGQVEVAFSDGSVARLAPNSSFAVEQLAAEGVILKQQSGLGYYEFNVGDGHPPFQVELQRVSTAPTVNTIFRVDMDSTPEIAVMSGAVEVTAESLPTAQVAGGQNLELGSGESAPYTLSSSIPPNSWDEWNEDRDEAISQEAQQQTTARTESTDSDGGGWNDLDYYGSWYPVQGTGNVWVPYGTGPGWDPFGYGYWGLYPGYGYTWISGYPWGWLPYHCGAWNYFSFGWGWTPGGCGSYWYPVSPVYGYSGYFVPAQPVYRVHAGGPLPAQRLVMVNRGAKAYGPWGPGRPSLIAAHGQHPASLQMNGQTIQPLVRRSFRSEAFSGTRGTPPGVRSLLGAAPAPAYPVEGTGSTLSSAGPHRGAGASQVVRRTPNSSVRPVAPVTDRNRTPVPANPRPGSTLPGSRPGYTVTPRPAPPPRIEQRPVNRPQRPQPGSRPSTGGSGAGVPRYSPPAMRAPAPARMPAPAPARMPAPGPIGQGGRGRR